MLAVFLDLSDRLTLVVGGGPVGRRKAGAIRAAGGRVRLICLEARPTGGDEGIEWLQEPFREAHLDGVSLVVAAATPEVNAEVAARARARGLWVNVAAGETAGDVHLASTVRRGGLLIGVGTRGAAPSLARRLRERLEEQLDERLAVWVELLAEVRPLVRATVGEERARRVVFEQLSDWSWLERLRCEGVDRVRAAMREVIMAAGGGSRDAASDREQDMSEDAGRDERR